MRIHADPDPQPCRQLHLLGDSVLHRPSCKSSPLLQSQELVHYPVQLQLLWVPGSRIGVAAASGGPVSLLVLQVVVVVVPWRPVTYVLRAHC